MNNLFLDTHTTIAVIGYGRFGKLLVKLLLTHSRAKIIVVSSKKIHLSHKNLEVKSLKEVKNADVVIPSVPISSFEAVIKQIAPLMRKDAIIMDVCSVKRFPVDVMKAYLPDSVQIIASHPMFGPDSYEIKKRLNGLKLVLWNIRAKEKNYRQVKKFFSDLELRIIELSPKDHDRFMASSLGYSYFIGKIGQRMNIRKTPIDTYDFQLLLDHVAIVKRDSEQLFLDMQTKNPYAKNMLTRFSNVFNDLVREINMRFSLIDKPKQNLL